MLDKWLRSVYACERCDRVTSRSELQARVSLLSDLQLQRPSPPSPLDRPILACLLSMASSLSQASLSSSLSIACKWGYCLERFEDPHALGAHVRAHVRAERMVPVDELEVETRDGMWYAREKQSQGFGEWTRRAWMDADGARGREGGEEGDVELLPSTLPTVVRPRVAHAPCDASMLTLNDAPDSSDQARSSSNKPDLRRRFLSRRRRRRPHPRSLKSSSHHPRNRQTTRSHSHSTTNHRRSHTLTTPSLNPYLPSTHRQPTRPSFSARPSPPLLPAHPPPSSPPQSSSRNKPPILPPHPFVPLLPRHACPPGLARLLRQPSDARRAGSATFRSARRASSASAGEHTASGSAPRLRDPRSPPLPLLPLPLSLQQQQTRRRRTVIPTCLRQDQVASLSPPVNPPLPLLDPSPQRPHHPPSLLRTPLNNSPPPQHPPSARKPSSTSRTS